MRVPAIYGMFRNVQIFSLLRLQNHIRTTGVVFTEPSQHFFHLLADRIPRQFHTVSTGHVGTRNFIHFRRDADQVPFPNNRLDNPFFNASPDDSRLIFDDVKTATEAAPGLFVPQILFAGFFIRIELISVICVGHNIFVR